MKPLIDWVDKSNRGLRIFRMIFYFDIECSIEITFGVLSSLSFSNKDSVLQVGLGLGFREDVIKMSQLLLTHRSLCVDPFSLAAVQQAS